MKKIDELLKLENFDMDSDGLIEYIVKQQGQENIRGLSSVRMLVML